MVKLSAFVTPEVLNADGAASEKGRYVTVWVSDDETAEQQVISIEAAVRETRACCKVYPQLHGHSRRRGCDFSLFYGCDDC